MNDAAALLAFVDAIAAAIPAGEEAIAAVIARTPYVASHEVRSSRGGVGMVIVNLAPASTVTIDAWKHALEVAQGRPLAPVPPQLTSPSNVPRAQWEDLPVYFQFERPWGQLACEHAYGNSAKRIRSIVVKPRL